MRGHYLRVLYRSVFARSYFRPLNTGLFYLALNGLGILNFENDEVSGERYLVRTWLPKAVKSRNPVFFDVGANVGSYSKALLKQFPSAHIHAFEPHPKTYERLIAQNLPQSRTKCHNIAVGASRGTLTLYDRSDIDGSTHASLHQETITKFHHQSSISTQVLVDTLDEITEVEGVPYIDFLKIDTEGHELAVLSGATRLLRENKIGPIQFEFNALNVYSRVFLKDFRDILYNYDLYRLLPKGILALDDRSITTELFAFQNILALPKTRK